jgi:hypothetical protein
MRWLTNRYFLAITIFGTVGSYIPVFFGSGMLSGWGIFGSFIGSLAGIWLAYKSNEYF